MSGGERSQDEAEIRGVETAFEAAWNHHDMHAFARICAEDADFVNVLGWWWKGRPQIEQKHAEAHAFMFRDSTLTHDDVQVRFLTPEIAVVHVRWSLIGHKIPNGNPGQPRKGIDTQVLQKRAGKWVIIAFQNTDSVPERPFPDGQPVVQFAPGAKL